MAFLQSGILWNVTNLPRKDEFLGNLRDQTRSLKCVCVQVVLELNRDVNLL